MKFPRRVKPFRGPLDPAPVAAVVMLLMLFMLLGSLVYTPGVLVDLGQNITVTSSNEVEFAGRTYKPAELDQLRSDLKMSSGKGEFHIVLEAGADSSVAGEVSNLFQISLAQGTHLTSTDDETVAVAVNFNGQCFYENQLVKDADLKNKLAQRLKIAAHNGKKLTMILWIDKAAENQVLTRLEDLAREAGISTEIRAQQP